MRTIICKKCGKKIDATLGICPFCGTTFPVDPQDEAAREKDNELEWAMSMDDEPLPGGFGPAPRPQDPNAGSGFGPDGVYRGAPNNNTYAQGQPDAYATLNSGMTLRLQGQGGGRYGAAPYEFRAFGGEGTWVNQGRANRCRVK